MATRQRNRADVESEAEPSNGWAYGILAFLASIGIVCTVIGGMRHGLSMGSVVMGSISLTLGIAAVAVGLLELAWLERIVDFVSWVTIMDFWWYLWSSSTGSLTDSDLVGRSGARTIWVILGLLFLVYGCLVALRIVDW